MILDNPAIVGVIVGIPSFILGILAYHQSRKVDRITEKQGVASANITAVNQVIDGLNQLIDNLQADNKLLREGISNLNLRLQEALSDRDKLREELRLLEKKYQ